MATKRIPITADQFSLLQTTDDWNIDEVPREYWGLIPGLQRLSDTVAVMASGTLSNPGVLNNIENAVAGADVIVHEPNPYPNEPEGNAYHYVFQKITDPRFPYLVHGPFRSETKVDHWFEAKQLDRYWGEST